jgi:hypothetical protein
LFTSPVEMHLFVVLVPLFISLASAKLRIRDSRNSGCSLISGDSSCSLSSSSSSSYVPYYDDRRICTQALTAILAHPYEVAYRYFAPMERDIRLQSQFWFNPSTRVAIAESFSTRFGVQVDVIDASGQFIYTQSAVSIPNAQFFSTARSWALNSGAVSTTGNGQVWYTFPIFDSFGKMLSISLVQATANMPLNQICYRETRRH